MASFTRREIEKLRGLCELALARELNHDLHHVVSACNEFRAGRIDEIDLDETVRDYVQGTSTRVRARYEDLAPQVAVARALAMGFLEAGEVPSGLSKKLEKSVAALKQVLI